MHSFRLSHLDDRTLLGQLVSLVERDRKTTASLLAHLGEVDARKLYLAAAYSSMCLYCVRELGFSEPSAYRRIRVARLSRDFPAILDAIAEGQLNLSIAIRLSPHLTTENAGELITAASKKSDEEIGELIALRFPRPDVLTRIEPLAMDSGNASIDGTEQFAPQLSAPRVESTDPRPKVTPLSPERFSLQLTMPTSMRNKLREAQDLLRHCRASGEVAYVLERGLDELLRVLKKQKFGATERPRNGASNVGSGNRRVRVHIRRAVWERDGGQCTFVTDSGKRCDERGMLEFDHIEPVALGGKTSLENLRLRCRAHNEYAAEQAFWREFMDQKREEARQAPDVRQKHGSNPGPQKPLQDSDVTPWLRDLGFTARDARRAAAHCESIPDASLEHRVRRALGYLAPTRGVRTSVGATAT